MRSLLWLVAPFLVAGHVGPTTQADDEWKWNPADLKEIAALQKRVAAKDGRFLLETSNWKIDTPVSARFTAETGRFMELFQAAFTKVVKGKSVVDVKPTLLVYGKKSEYEEKVPDGSRGFFKYRWNGKGEWEEYCLYTYIAGEEKDLASFNRAILQHEATHALLRNLVGTKEIPIWFNEGLATYVQFWSLQDKIPPHPGIRYKRSFYRAHLKEHCLKDPAKHLDLAALLSLTNDQWNPDKMGPEAKHQYAVAESFVEFLVSTPKLQGTFNRILNTVIAQEGAALLSEQEVGTLQGQWREHVRKIAQ